MASIVEAQDFRWLSEATQIGRYVLDSGFTSSFCRQCGSPIRNHLRGSAWVWIPAGGLDDSLAAAVAVHLYTSSRARSDTVAMTGQCFETMPGIEQFVKLPHD